ncbi:AAA family ATPase [Vibrio azureus]|uniref:Putative ATPase n=1 Tax=Vibrio azureus NBRC 104587 TaxID=1219077 RepID=U3C7H8_9VIBR|nr:ATPase [Vibrio azureus]AUI86830.1 AAA family ATPase [Vibrio azureus]GAD74393.1 putative ATPase [Vibrio azureus NBRC 104587]
MSSEHHQVLTPQIIPPSIPSYCEELGVPTSVIDSLILKFLAVYPKIDLVELTQRLGVVSSLVECSLSLLKNRNFVQVFKPHDDGQTSSYSHLRYSLTELGALEAEHALNKDPYVGAVPVSIEDYWRVVQQQDVREAPITRTDIERALSEVYGSEALIPVLGPAINSGRALLLYGHAGTGKSYVASKVLNAMNTSVFIPYGVYVDGRIIKVFSQHHHQRVSTPHSNMLIKLKANYDQRWVLCERPNIQVGGELTMSMLEVQCSKSNPVWTAPLQMMANNGILVVDDLGRQPMPVESLLNRWIVPMEYQVDHLSLPNGQQLSIPFVLTLAFSSNLAPSEIADPAFLRRLGYKIEFHPLQQQDYKALWLSLASREKLTLPPELFERLYQLHREFETAYLPCLAKDLLGICRDILVFESKSNLILPDILQRAWELYFTETRSEGA